MKEAPLLSQLSIINYQLSIINYQLSTATSAIPAKRFQSPNSGHPSAVQDMERWMSIAEPLRLTL
jgi:hypothetical protein